MKRTLISVNLVVLLALPLLAAASDWECRLAVQAGTATNVLSFGQRSDAHDGNDGRYDVPAMLQGAVQARFFAGGQGYWRDIKGPGRAEWLLRVDVIDITVPVTLSWNDCHVPAGTTVTVSGVGEVTAPAGSYVLGAGEKRYDIKVSAE